MGMWLPKGLLVLSIAALCACSESDLERGNRLTRERRWVEALAAYKKAIEAYPHDYEAAWGIARIYCHHTHLPEKCLAWTDRLREAYPDRADYRQAAAQGWRDRATEAREAGDEAAAAQAEARATELEK